MATMLGAVPPAIGFEKSTSCAGRSIMGGLMASQVLTLCDTVIYSISIAFGVGATAVARRLFAPAR